MKTVETYKIDQVLLTVNGKVDSYTDWISKCNFIDHLETLSVGKLYLFGYQRNILAKVDKIETEGDEIYPFIVVYLTQLVNLDEDEVEILATNDTAKFELCVI